jgi:hypothetical protein
MASQRKTHLCGASQPGAQFVQLEVRNVQVAEAVLVQVLSVPACARKPRGDSSLTRAEDAFSRGSVQPTGSCREHHGDLLGGSFQTVQRSVASSTERGAAGLTAKRLDRLSRAMLAISDEGMDVRIGDSEVRALLVRTGVALGVHSLGCSPAAFHLTPGA